MNNSAIKITEAISRDNLIEALFFNYFTDIKKAEEACQQVFSKGILIGCPLTFVNNQGTSVLFNGSVYKDVAGDVLGAVMVGREVSDKSSS